MERERKIKRAKEREKKGGETGGESPLVFFPALLLALFFARAPLSERLEQANLGDFHFTYIPVIDPC